ncbi:MAG: relaxase/mobilization nuclease domain-containing protein [Oscillospiraceae bacterium]|nr:relaxase/mobilization nuclease domain-containing protein [Oscillospiraceae bacterium]
MASVKFVAAHGSVGRIADYVENREKTNERLITGVNCLAQTAVDEFEAVKRQFNKTDGREYYHIVQAFSPDDPIDFGTAHELGIKLAEYFKGYQCLVATHTNTNHIHNHIIMNSVNFENGKKYHQSAKDMQMVKEYCNKLCLEYGFSITEAKAQKNPEWKMELRDRIKDALAQSSTRERFIEIMEEWGYKVKWEPNQKHITYTTPENIRCRDSKLFDPKLLRENMEQYFKMGGERFVEFCRETEDLGGDSKVDVNNRVLEITGITIGVAAVAVAASDDEKEKDDALTRAAKTANYTAMLVQELIELHKLIEELRRKDEQEEELRYDYAPEYDYDEEYRQYHGFGGMGGMSM